MDGGQTVVAGADAVVAVPFEVVQEGAHQRSVEISNIELAGLLMRPIGGIAKHEPDRVTVGSDGVRARAALPHQPVGEERLECGSEHAHGLPPKRSSRRVAASSISSGAADRYQYVPAGFTWPRYVDSSAMRLSASIAERCHSMSVRTAKPCLRS